MKEPRPEPGLKSQHLGSHEATILPQVGAAGNVVTALCCHANRVRARPGRSMHLGDEFGT